MATNIANAASYTYTVAPNGAYPDTDGIQLTDGIIDGADLGSVEVGFLYGGSNFTIDLGDVYVLSYVRFYLFTEGTGGGVQGPATLVVKGSTDNVSFDTLGSFSAGIDWNNADAGKRWTNNLTVSGNYRYVEFIMTNAGDWLFIREAEVYGEAEEVLSATANIHVDIY
jgi:hypothetical protein